MTDTVKIILSLIIALSLNVISGWINISRSKRLLFLLITLAFVGTYLIATIPDNWVRNELGRMKRSLFASGHKTQSANRVVVPLPQSSNPNSFSTIEKDFTEPVIEYKMVFIKDTSRKNFYIGQTEVTQKQWKTIMGNNPSHFKCDDCPVENVSFYDAKKFIEELNKKTGKKYRLPESKEWLSVTPGKGIYYEADASFLKLLNEVAWWGANSKNRTHPVATKKPTEYQLYDMLGNVAEWTNTTSNYQYSEDTLDEYSRHDYLIEGSSYFWWDETIYVPETSMGESEKPNYKSEKIGFRLAL